jgi:malic enzyme
MFHVVIFSAAPQLNGLYIKSSSGQSQLLPYFSFPGWGVVIIVDSATTITENLSFATAAAAAALRRELGTISNPIPLIVTN